MTPATFVDISVTRADFARDFMQLINSKMYTFLPSRKMTKLCCLNQDIPISQRSSVMQNWLQANSPCSLKLHWTCTSGVSCRNVMLEKHYKLQPKPKMTDDLKVALHLQTIWEELLQEHINKAVANFTKLHHSACWLPAWLWLPYLSLSICSNSVHLQVCIIISSPTTSSF